MSEKEKSRAQCSHSVTAPILGSSKGNQKSNSPSKRSCHELLSNVVEVSAENTCDKYKQSAPIKSDKKNLQMLFYQLKVPVVMILEMSIQTQIPKIFRRFSC